MTQFGFPRQRTVNQSHFAIAPQPGVSRSVFKLDTGHKTTLDAGWLVPIYYNEVIPGDSFKVKMTAFTRLATAKRPVMDNMYLDSFFFFVPYRLLWSNWKRFMGERTPNTDSSIDYLLPQVTLGDDVNLPCSIWDYFGIPSAQQWTAVSYLISAMPFRAYNLIYNEWFRDENLQNSVPVPMGDGPDSRSNYALRRRGKRHDQFTSALPSAQKGPPVTLPLGLSAPVRTSATDTLFGVHEPIRYNDVSGSVSPGSHPLIVAGGTGGRTSGSATQAADVYPRNLEADLSQAVAATINTFRQAAALQQFLERDARGGTRYTEIIRSHFGVLSPDSRLQRPEYLGGGSSPITVAPVAQQSETGTTPLGDLAGVGMGIAQHGFSSSFVEHGIVIGLVSIRADMNYQQGLAKFWSRRTRHDFPWPEYAHLGEDTVLRKEIYATGQATDNEVFGYQERYYDLRYDAPKITGMFRSGIPGSLDMWHLAQNFTAPPVLGNDFIVENPPINRVVSAGELATNQQFLFDSTFSVRAVRPIPVYGVPGLTRI